MINLRARKRDSMIHLISINEYSKIPKYQQIINSILTAIENGDVKTDDKLPSVNELLIEFDNSHDTTVRAYNIIRVDGDFGKEEKEKLTDLITLDDGPEYSVDGKYIFSVPPVPAKCSSDEWMRVAINLAIYSGSTKKR